MIYFQSGPNRTALASILLAISFSFAAAQSVESTREDGYVVITGTISADGWFDDAREILLDFGGYSAWATRYMDGNDPASVDDWAQFTRFEYQSPDEMIVYYNMTLPWPLNRRDNHVDFVLTVDEETILMEMERPPFGLNDIRMEIDLSRQPDVVFVMEIKFWWIVDKLIDQQEFQDYLADRVVKMQGNMRDRALGNL